MTFDVILTKQAEDGYVARPVLWPEAAVHGATRQEALNLVRALISDLLSSTQIVQVEVAVPERQGDNPWQAKAGMFANDPTWDDFLAVIADYRADLDQQRATELA